MRVLWCLFLFMLSGCEWAVIDPFARASCRVCDAGADVSPDASTAVQDAGGLDAGLDAGLVRDGGGSRLFVAAAEQYPMVWHHAATPGAQPDMRLRPIAAQGFAAVAGRLVVVGAGRIGSFDGIDLMGFDGGATQSLELPPGPGPSPQVLFDRSLTAAGGTMWFLAVGTIDVLLDPLNALTAQQMPMGSLVVNARSAANQPSSDRLYTSGNSGILIWSSASALVGATSAQPLFERRAEITVIAAGRLFVSEGGTNNLLIWEAIAQAGTSGHPITAFEADTVIALPSPIVDMSVKARGSREALLIALASGAVLIFEDASAVRGLTDVTRTIIDPSIDVPARVIMGVDETLYVGDSNGVTVIGNSLSAPRFVAELPTNSRVIDLLVTEVAPPP